MKLQRNGSGFQPQPLVSSLKKAGFKSPNEFDFLNSFPRPDQGCHNQELDRACECQLEMMNFLDNDVIRKIKLTLSRQQTLIKGRYISMLNHMEKTKKNFVNFQQKIYQWESNINENEYVKILSTELSNYQNYSTILRRDFEEIDNRIKEEETKIEGLLAQLKKKKNALTEINHENIIWASKLTSLKTIFNEIVEKKALSTSKEQVPKSAPKPMSSGERKREDGGEAYFKSKALRTSTEKMKFSNTVRATGKSFQEGPRHVVPGSKLRSEPNLPQNSVENTDFYKEEFTEGQEIVVFEGPVTQSAKVDFERFEKMNSLKRQLTELEAQNNILKKEFLTRTDRYWDTKKLFEQGMAIGNKHLLKSQEIVRDSGLAGSLLFEMKRNIGSETRVMQDYKIKAESKTATSQDREARLIIHGALRRLFDKKMKEKTDPESESFWIPWEVFMTFNAQQIMGILALKPEGLDKIRAVWGVKERPINKLIADYKLRIAKVQE